MWIFQGGRIASALFSTRELAEAWIRKHELTGMLTKYPVDTGVYEWAIEKGYFNPKNDEQRSSDFIGRFSSASQEHYHYELGVNRTG